jgi:hypothetical protein
VLAGALLACLSLRPARADDVLEWSPPDAGITVVVRGFGLLADALDTTEKRFGAEPSVAKAVAAVRAWAPGGFAFGARRWGDGLALDRGAALYVSGPQQMRLVVGTDDAAAARRRLVEVFNGLHTPSEVTDAGVRLGKQALNCAQRNGFLVCDSGTVPEKAPGRPALEGAPVGADAPLLVHVNAAAMAQIDPTVPLSSFWLGLETRDDTVRLVASAALKAPIGAQLALAAADGKAAGLRSVDSHSPAVLKLSFDGPKVLAGVESMAGSAPPIGPLWAALKAGWSGDLVVSLAGSFAHPVVAIGLAKPEAAAAIVDGIAAVVRQAGARADVEPAGPDGVGGLAIEGGDPGGTVRVHLHHGVCDDALVFALAPADVARCRSGKAATLPDALARKGTQGLLVWDALSLFSSGLPADVIEVHLPGVDPVIAPVLTVLQVYAHRVDELGAAVRAQGEELRAEIWWRLL